MKQEFEIGMNATGTDYVYDGFDPIDDNKQYIPVIADIEYSSFVDAISEINLVSIDGKEIVHLSEEFKKEIISKIEREL